MRFPLQIEIACKCVTGSRTCRGAAQKESRRDKISGGTGALKCGRNAYTHTHTYTYIYIDIVVGLSRDDAASFSHLLPTLLLHEGAEAKIRRLGKVGARSFSFLHAGPICCQSGSLVLLGNGFGNA